MIIKLEAQIPVTLERLLIRGQFILGPKQFAPNQFWSCIQLPQGFHLSVHQDLAFISETHGHVAVTLIGCAIDPYHPQHTEEDILHVLVDSASELTSLIEATTSLAGRWIVIYNNPRGTYLFTDPCGFRQVFYHSDGKQVWCASQPELINANNFFSLDNDDKLLHFLLNKDFSREESAWVGTRTIYKNCSHLLPNHYLDVCRLQQIRFYPVKVIPRKETNEIVETATSILQGIMNAINNRYKVTFALTAGWDSRVFLAASKDISAYIEFYVDKKGFSIFDLLYWEQRNENWGAQYPAEQIISFDEISPFNCHLMIETLFSSS